MTTADPAPDTTAAGDPATAELRVVDGAQVKRGLGFAVTSFAVNAVVGLASAVVTARLYGVEVIGEYALVTASWLMLIQFSSVGEQTALARELATLPVRDRRATALFVPVLAFSAVLTTLVAVPVLLLGTAALRGPVGQPELVLPAVVLALGFVLIDNTSWNLDSVLGAYQAGAELFVSRLTQVAGFLVLSIVFRAFTDSVWGLTWATVASFAVALCVRLVLVRRYLVFAVERDDVRDGLARLPSVLGFALRLVPARFAGGITNNAGTWVLGAFGTVAAVGAFSRAASIATRMNDASYRVGEILFPAMVQRHRAGDHEGFERVLLRSIRPLAFGVLLLAAASGGAASGVMDVFGEGFSRAAPALAMLMFTAAIWIVVTVSGGAVVAIGRPGASAWMSLTRMAVTVGAMVPATKAWGAEGVAGSMLFGIVVHAVLQQWWLHRVLLTGAATRAFAALYARGLLAGAPALLAALAVDRALPGTLGTAIALAAGAAAYLVAIVAVGGVTAEDRHLVRSVVTRRRRGRTAP